MGEPPEKGDTRVAPALVRFELLHEDAGTGARRGRLHTPHGTDRDAHLHAGGHRGQREGAWARTICATLGAQIILGNTYHLMLRPGEELVGELGGLHRFISWDRPMLTD